MAFFGKKNKKVEEIEEAKPQDEVVEESAKQPTIKLPKGEDAEAYGIILNSHITEKVGLMNAENKYVFKVYKKSNKIQIKKAIEKLYKVDVKGVTVISVPSKSRRVGRYEGTKPGYKKAIVTLKEGNKIDVAA